MTHIDYLIALSACSDAVAFAEQHPSLLAAWRACPRSDWMVWLLDDVGAWDERTRRVYACRCVRETPLGDGRTVWDLLTDERSRHAVEVAERYSRGEATDEELGAAWAAAREAGAAAAAEAEAAWAAWAAARAAAGAAGAAARAAAARAAAAEAAWAAQATILRDMIDETVIDSLHPAMEVTP